VAGQVSGLRQRPDRRDHRRLWLAQRHHLRQWPGLRHLRQWRGPRRRRSVRLPRHSAQPWRRIMLHRVSPHRRDRPHRALQGHAPKSSVQHRRSDRP
jgi:hypothetical protein